MYSNIDEAWKVSNDLDKYRKNAPVTNVKDATNTINFKTSSEKISDLIFFYGDRKTSILKLFLHH